MLDLYFMELEDTQNSLYKNLVKEEFFFLLFLKDFFADWEFLLLLELPPGHLSPLLKHYDPCYSLKVNFS